MANGMQAFDIRDQEQAIAARGTFLRFDAPGSGSIGVRADGQDLGRLWPGESLELIEPAGSWVITSDQTAQGQVRIGFGRIQSVRRAMIEKPPVMMMRAGVSQVAAGGQLAGWVSGNPASMAAAATVDCVFDLGPDWDQYGLVSIVMVSTAPAASYQGVAVSGGNTPAYDNALRMGFANSAGSGSIYVTNVTTTGGGNNVMVRPHGRYVIVKMTNDAANPQGAGASVSLIAYPT